MTKDVLLRLQSEQTAPTGEKEFVTSELVAEYYERDDVRYLLYEETGEDGQVVKNRLKWKKGRVELTRRGAVGLQMLFEQELRYATQYQTPYGNFPLDVCTESVEILEKTHQISISLCYSLETGNELLSRHKISFFITERLFVK
jgi:uncharacterized beta-barrel protein YwiB (DUF1934 family)